MPAAIAYDMVRLFLGPLADKPRGIDRVEIGYARFLLENWPGDWIGTLPTPWGIRWYDRHRALRGLDRVEELWSEKAGADEDAALRRIRRWLAGERMTDAERNPRRSRPALQSMARFADLLSATGFSFGRSVVKSAPRNAIYINVGQLGLAFPQLLSWLEHRRDMKAIFMLHDVIPLEHPEFVAPSSRRYHGKMVDNTVRRASGLIVTTAAARESVLNALRQRGRHEIPAETIPVPVSTVFLEKETPDEALRAHDYFVVCSAIEARKNHLLLLNVWRELVRRRGECAPRLVMVGSPAWGGQPVLDMLERSIPLRGRVIHVQGMSSPALRRLIANAKGLLMPSFAEGFGSPLIEALTVGTPVIASDIPAHRENAGEFAIYRDPTDGPGWLQEICRLADGGEAIAEIRARIATYRPFTWPEYFTRIDGFLKKFA